MSRRQSSWAIQNSVVPLRHLATLAVLAALAGSACAAEPAAKSACDSPDTATLQNLLNQVSDCQKDARFLAALGRRLNEQGHYLDAAEHLERALMLEPDLKEVQLSYAIALTGSGDLLSATELLDNLLADPASPATVRALIRAQKDSIDRINNLNDWKSRFSLTTRLGYDSNLQGSPNLSSLTLTLAGQTQVLQLEDSYLARSGNNTRVDAQFDLQRTQPNGSRWDAVASLRTRQSPSLHNADTSQMDLLLEHHSNLSAGAAGYGHYLSLNATGLHSGGNPYYQGWGGGAGWEGAWPALNGVEGVACQARLGAEWQQRTYIQSTILSGRYTGISANWSCAPNIGLQWLLAFRAGQDAALEADRAGGHQDQYSLRLAAYLPLGQAVKSGVLLDYDQARQQDTRGYSTIIDNGRTRITTRQSVRLEYQRQLTTGVQWLLGAESVAQASTLALFQMDSRGVYTGLRFNW